MTENANPSADYHPAIRRASSYPISSAVVSGIFVFLDGLWFLMSGAAVYSYYIGGNLWSADLYPAAVCFVWLVALFLFRYSGLYRFNAVMAPFGNLAQIVVSCATAFLFLMAVFFSLKVSGEISRVWTFSYATTALTGIFVTRVIGYFVISHLANIGVFARNVLIVGGGRQAERLLEQLEKEKPRFNNVIGVFDDRHARIGPSVAGVPVLGNLSEMMRYVRANRVDDIIVTLPWNADERLLSIISRLRELPANIHLGSDLVGFRFPYRPSPNHFIGIPMMQVVKTPLSGWNIVVKWLEDRVLSALLIVLFAPILAAVALAIRLESPGPVIFRQKRYGYNNEVFHIYKFRSMYHGEVPVKTVQATKDDPRITRVGRFIRRTSLDELPQLFNVLFGDMSLVGPRPHAVDHNEEYGAIIKGYFGRHRVKPGITGWAQVNGLRGETDTLEKMEARVRYDTYYAENWSLLFDLQILARTAVVGFVNKNAY
ncbi:undecaprenyl-phosphate glucose phosphotransferase [Hwanghaeella grinnelliae]|uniref:Undecaprenyl-phosphate glucose phosphotransferase n=1 Tax=Hwanghaeella grinnelliae TaxID=2500179 RepID=A0A3S2Z6C8_9PROT|nr:undecaprenyl-phosphate glucose phosphotransferase [Hwanghaeella grinnelliae]RVU34090.1 undecaprenyl-phosphate glucose phosphotransferase [Hwanghaeella grinnelliae]